MKKEQRGCAGDRKQAEADRQTRRQCGCRNQDGRKEQEGKRVLQPAGQIQKAGEFDDIERQQSSRIGRLQPPHRVERDLQCKIEDRRQADDDDAGHHRQVEFQSLHDDENGGELAQHGEPAEPQDGVEADLALRMAKVEAGVIGHGRSLASHRSDYKSVRLGATSRLMRCCAPGGDAAKNRRMNQDEGASPGLSAPSSTTSPAIEVVHLTKLYKATRAVDDVSFRIARGSITGLLGGNGAGKTTTIAMIMGLVLPTSGQVEVLGHPMPAQSARVLGRMNFESPYVDMPMRLTVRQNLTIFGRLYAVANLRERIAQLAADLDLNEFLDRASGKLSAGQKTRVALAKALINQPELLLLDEPTASLDPDTADWVRGHLDTYRKAQGATILLASHNMLEVERLCDRVIIMKRGRVEDDDSPARIMSRYNRTTLEDVFLDVARGRTREVAR